VEKYLEDPLAEELLRGNVKQGRLPNSAYLRWRLTILIISGEFDLSVGAIYAVAGVVTGLLAKHFGLESGRLRVGVGTDPGAAE
jgi:hypothetical protein